MNNNIKNICLILISLALLAGCSAISGIISPEPPPTVTSEAPIPKSYPLTTQEKIQAVYHWGLLAEHIAGLVKVALETEYTNNRPGRPIYVAPSGITPFEKVFHALLMTKLFETGLSISNNPEQSLLLSFDIELVKYPKRHVKVEKEIYRSLAMGLIVKNEISFAESPNVSNKANQSGEWARPSKDEYLFTLPENEIIITSSLTYNDRYIMRNSSVYYIDDPEWWQYAQRSEITHPPIANYTLTDK